MKYAVKTEINKKEFLILKVGRGGGRDKRISGLDGEKDISVS